MIPQDYRTRPVAVVGAGTLGRRIALMFATRGGQAHITDPNAEQGGLKTNDRMLNTHF